MKKIAKIAVGVTLAASLAVSAGVLAGCANNEKTGEAYGLVHGAGYVGYAKIVVDGDKVKDLTLTEVCLPTQVKATDAVAEADKVGNYYKTVSYGSVTLTYDEAAADYMVGTTAFKTYLQTEANAKAYYEAVTSNSLKVTVGGQQKSDIMTKATLSKEENGYWTKQDKNDNDYSRWKLNRDATVEYVKANGVSKLNQLTKTASGTDDKSGATVTYWTDGTVVTGATWNDLNPSDKGGKVYFTYAELIIKANDVAAAK